MIIAFQFSPTMLGELCAGSAICIGGLIGFYSLRMSPEKRGQLFQRGTGAPVSKVTLAVLATILLVFGGSLIIAGLSSGNAPRWIIPVFAGAFGVLMICGIIDAIRNRTDKNDA